MRAKFATKQGGIYRNQELNEAVKNNTVFKNFTKNFAKVFNDNLRIANGDINSVNSFEIPQDLHPKFNSESDLFSGFTILIDDTAETEVEITDYTIVNGKWKATFIITITDWFGMDNNDVDKYQYVPYIGNGFAAWWLLQHTRGYKPLETKISCAVTLSGNL
jgi:hypothetical protein